MISLPTLKANSDRTSLKNSLGNMLADKSCEDKIKDIKDGENIAGQSVEERLGTRYKWKRRIPASRFGNVVKAGGKRKDEQFTDEILSFNCKYSTHLCIWPPYPYPYPYPIFNCKYSTHLCMTNCNAMNYSFWRHRSSTAWQGA